MLYEIKFMYSKKNKKILNLINFNNNWISPATGQPIITLSQDMILGSHFLTAENFSFYHLLKKIKVFNTISAALSNYEHGQIYLHSFIWIKIKKIKMINLPKKRKYMEIKMTNKKIIVSQKNKKTYKINYIRTTSGRILFNQSVKNFL